MACSAYRRIDDVLYAANKTTGSRKTTCPGKRYFHYLTAVWVTVACLWSACAAADMENPFVHSLSQSGQVQDTDIDRQVARIAELENRDTLDAYTPELAEAYLGLAGKLTALENYAGALETYGKALQIVRVSDGLASPNQLPILQAQLDCMEKLHQWSRYDATLNLIYNISQDYFPAGDDARIDVLDQLGKWQLKAAEEGLLERMETRAKAVADLYEREIKQIEASGTANVSDYGLSSLHLGRAYAKLAVTRVVLSKPARSYRAITSEPTLASSRCRTVRLAAGDSSQTCMATPMPDLNYYQAPENGKKQEAGFYLEELRTAILDAAATLEEKKDFGNRELLIDEFRFLAESYTKIVSTPQVN